MEKRTERDSDRRKREVADLLVLLRPAKACRMAQTIAEKLKHTGPAEKERVASVQESSWLVRQSRLCRKEKKRSGLSRVPGRKLGESQDRREPHLGERQGNQGRNMERKEWTSQ